MRAYDHFMASNNSQSEESRGRSEERGGEGEEERVE